MWVEINSQLYNLDNAQAITGPKNDSTLKIHFTDGHMELKFNFEDAAKSVKSQLNSIVKPVKIITTGL